MKEITIHQVLFLHARLIAETGGSHGVRDLGLLAAALDRPWTTFDDQELYPEIFDKAAAMMESITRNHPFLDGNKRTAIGSAALFLRQNGYRLTVSNSALESFTMKVATTHMRLATISRWFREHSTEI